MCICGCKVCMPGWACVLCVHGGESVWFFSDCSPLLSFTHSVISFPLFLFSLSLFLIGTHNHIFPSPTPSLLSPPSSLSATKSINDGHNPESGRIFSAPLTTGYCQNVGISHHHHPFSPLLSLGLSPPLIFLKLICRPVQLRLTQIDRGSCVER